MIATNEVQNYEQMYVIEMTNGDYYVVDQQTCQSLRRVRSQAVFVQIGDDDVLTRNIAKIRKAKPEDVWLRKQTPAVREMIKYRIDLFLKNTNRLPSPEVVAKWIDTATQQGPSGLFA